MSDGIEHPPYYGGGDNPYETIKVLRATMSPAEFQGFCKGNVIKYTMRAGKKGGAGQAAVDLKKARDYLDFALDALKPEPLSCGCETKSGGAVLHTCKDMSALMVPKFDDEGSAGLVFDDGAQDAGEGGDA